MHDKTKNAFGPALVAAALLASSALADEVNFEGLPTGTIVSGVQSADGAGPIGVYGFNPSLGAQNAAVVFDSANPTGGDDDLGTPNADFGGPGVGSGGSSGAAGENGVALGKILIVDEHLVTGPGGTVSDPDDAAVDGATLEFDFSELGTVSIQSVQYIDVEMSRTGWVEVFDAFGASLGTASLAAVGNNGVGSADLGGVSAVQRMVLNFGGSGAVTGFRFEVDCVGVIGDTIWNDLDGDGIQQNTELGIAGIPVALMSGGQTIAETTTDAEGDYRFDGLCAGDYRVTVDETALPEGLVPSPCMAGMDATLDNNCSPATVQLANNNSVRLDIDFGYRPEPYIFCTSNPNSTGQTAGIDYSGSTSIMTNMFRFIISNLPPFKPAYLIYGTTTINAPFGDGVRCVGGQVFRYVKIPSTGASGMVAIPLDFTQPPLSSGPGQVVPGVAIYFQLWFRDPSGPSGFNTTDGMCVTFAP